MNIYIYKKLTSLKHLKIIFLYLKLLIIFALPSILLKFFLLSTVLLK